MGIFAAKMSGLAGHWHLCQVNMLFATGRFVGNIWTYVPAWKLCVLQPRLAARISLAAGPYQTPTNVAGYGLFADGVLQLQTDDDFFVLNNPPIYKCSHIYVFPYSTIQTWRRSRKRPELQRLFPSHKLVVSKQLCYVSFCFYSARHRPTSFSLGHYYRKTRVFLNWFARNVVF